MNSVNTLGVFLLSDNKNNFCDTYQDVTLFLSIFLFSLQVFNLAPSFFATLQTIYKVKLP